MNNSVKKDRQSKEMSYMVENRQFIVHRVFNNKQTVKDLLAAEISHGILQNVPLNNLPAPDRMEL